MVALPSMAVTVCDTEPPETNVMSAFDITAPVTSLTVTVRFLVAIVWAVLVASNRRKVEVT